MALQQPVFDAFGNLTPKARKVLKELLQAQELSRFIELVGYTPKPDGPLVKELMSDILLDKIAHACTKKDSVNIIDAMRRQGVVREAFSELSEQVTNFHKSLINKAKASA